MTNEPRARKRETFAIRWRLRLAPLARRCITIRRWHFSLTRTLCRVFGVWKLSLGRVRMVIARAIVRDAGIGVAALAVTSPSDALAVGRVISST